MTVRWTDHDLQAYLRRGQPAPMSEETWMAGVRRIARDAGYTFQYHVWDSRRTVYGYPDLTLVHREPGHPLYMVELKTESGIVSEAQQAWLEALAGTSGIVAEVWKPSMLSEIAEKLRA